MMPGRADQRWLTSLLFDGMSVFERIPLLPKGVTCDWGSSDSRFRKLLNAFQAQFSVSTPEDFGSLLGIFNVTSDLFSSAFCAQPQDVSLEAKLEYPEWILHALDVTSRECSGRKDAAPKAVTPDKEDFLSFVTPLVEECKQQLLDGLAKIPAIADIPLTAERASILLMRPLLSRMRSIIQKTLILELNVARLSGDLDGANSEARYADFVASLNTPGMRRRIFSEYPILFRLLCQSAQKWVHTSLEFLSRLAADWEGLQERFPEVASQTLAEVVPSGDTHSGRSVCVLTFTNGCKLIYKPHSIDIDNHFQEILRWVNEFECLPTFRLLKVWSRDSYGWCEFVPHEPCRDLGGVQNFYRRQGGYLALLYVLDAIDFHWENLIASGEHPVLVDLEALFHPRLRGISREFSHAMIDDALSNSVFRSGLLPRGSGVKFPDMSGLGGAPGQLTSWGVPAIELHGTDEMRCILKPAEMSGQLNRPALEGHQLKARDFSNEIVEGFTAVYKTLVDNKASLLKEGGPVEMCADDEIRVVIRPTRSYASIITDSLHPDFCHTALERDCLLLTRLWTSTKTLPALKEVLVSEFEDVYECDIPIFKSRPSSTTIWTSAYVPINDFFERSSLEVVKSRIQDLNDEDCRRQVYYIRASLAATSSGTDILNEPRSLLRRTDALANQSEYLQAARQIADQISLLSFKDKDSVSWIGMSSHSDEGWRFGTLGLDLYNGLSGIALFLGYLGKLTGHTPYTELAKSCCRTILVARKQSRLESDGPTFGAFSSRGGLVYAFAHLGTLWSSNELFDEAEEVCKGLRDLISADENADLMTGSAGLVGALLALYDCTSSKVVLEIAKSAADRTVQNWRETNRLGIALTGMSHGAAGIAYLLMRFAHYTGNEAYRACALEAIAYERTAYSSAAKNWPDYRALSPEVISAYSANKFEESVKFQVDWCHGAAGIGLARVGSLPYWSDSDAFQEIDAAIQTTIRRGFHGTHCLCHGDLGNLELLLSASQLCPQLVNTGQMSEIATSILQRISRLGWLCGTPAQVPTPGLMVGLAGIGYGLLRVFKPHAIPSILQLASPVG